MNASRPRLSLVMPVYNVAPWLRQCLDSVLAQTLPPDEVIIIDDGATDDSPVILAEYARRCERLRVTRQANAGLSAARNAGLAQARGEYLLFVDSDDWLEPTLCERLLAMAQADDLDMALANGMFDFEGREPARPIYPVSGDGVPETGLTQGSAWMRARLARGDFLHMVWLHLYRRDFIERLGLRFVPPYVHEDVVWTTRALLAARRVRYEPAPLYHYRIPVRRFAADALDRRLSLTIDSSVYNARELAAIAATLAADDPQLAALLRWQLVDGALSIFHKLRRLSTPALRRERLRRLRREGLYGLLWRNATSLAQRRRIARYWLKSLA